MPLNLKIGMQFSDSENVQCILENVQLNLKIAWNIYICVYHDEHCLNASLQRTCPLHSLVSKLNVRMRLVSSGVQAVNFQHLKSGSSSQIAEQKHADAWPSKGVANKIMVTFEQLALM